MEKRSPIDLTWVAVAGLALLAAGGGAALLWWTGVFGGRAGGLLDAADPAGEKSARSASGLSDVFRYDLGTLKKTDPALVKYRESAAVAVGMKQARAVAAGPEDRIYVAGDKVVRVFEATGAKRAEFPLADDPRCLAVGGPQHAFPGRIYVGMRSRVEVLDPTGKRVAAWDDPGPKAILTSIAAGERDVFVADAGNRVVYRYDLAGKRLGAIGRRDPAKDSPGFVIPSPYFDVALTHDHQLRVANPGRHRVEGYSADGTLEGYWGESGEQIDRFCGCCNPANIAILPDGRFVTAEKGIPRVKVYEDSGVFWCVVAGPETLAPNATIVEETRDEHRLPVLDVAADSRGRVLVLDPGSGTVRVFEPKPTEGAATKKGA